MASGQLPEDMLPWDRPPEKGTGSQDHLPVTPAWPAWKGRLSPTRAGRPRTCPGPSVSRGSPASSNQPASHVHQPAQAHVHPLSGCVRATRDAQSVTRAHHCSPAASLVTRSPCQAARAPGAGIAPRPEAEAAGTVRVLLTDVIVPFCK